MIAPASRTTPPDSGGGSPSFAGGPGSAEPVRVAIESSRDQLWAEALKRRREPAWLQPDLALVAAAAAEEARRADTLFEDGVAEYLTLHPAGGFSLKEAHDGIAKAVGGRDVSRFEARVQKALRNAGWTSRRERIEGRRGRFWFPPRGVAPQLLHLLLLPRRHPTPRSSPFCPPSSWDTRDTLDTRAI